MADETGTLWEHDSKSASLNHGLSSAAGAFIIKGITGIIEIDEAAQVITFDERTPKTAGYKVSIGLEQGCLYVDSDGMNRSVKAVSYTHLDVYKRQGTGRKRQRGSE